MLNEKMRELGARRSVIRELFEYGKMRKGEIGEDKVFDFSLGNPSVKSPSELTDAMLDLLEQEDPVALHGYTSADGEVKTRTAIAEYLNRKYDESITPECIYMTLGAAGALTSALTAVVQGGEEVIVLTPYFPEYRVFIERLGAIVREVPTRCGDFSLDAAAVEEAINEKTAAIIINSPNNPTGAVYTESDIIELCEVLCRAEKKYEKPIYLISDEPYRELVYTGDEVPYITKYYNDSIVAYSYSKSLSLPGERIGYSLICPRMTDFAAVRQAIMGAGRALGFVCAPSLLQKLIARCVGMTSDFDVYKKNADILYSALTEYGYELTRPAGAFYLFVKALENDAVRFSERAKEHELLLVPSNDFGCEGYVRISYCVSTEQVERALPAFKALAESYGK